MLRLAKWTYDLGVKQERQRIARYLEAEASALNNEYGVEHDMLREIPDSAKQRKQRLDLKHAVTMRVSEIVNNILKPRHEDFIAFSLMFPDEEKK